MVDLFGDSRSATIGPVPVVTSHPLPVARPADGDPLARLGDILPQVLQLYGLGEAIRPEASRQTKRPDVARVRRRVG